jgi:type IV pilus assembly protein PilW
MAIGSTRRPRRVPSGMSLVEMMVGLALGLFIVAGASVLMTNQMGDNRRLLLETQIHQDLRAASDLIIRDLRRAGWWGSADSSVWRAGAAAPLTNPYGAVSPAASDNATNQINYSISSANTTAVVEDNAVASNEQFGFRLANNVIQMQVGDSGWQALTDANTIKVTTLNVTVADSVVALACFACAAGNANCPPQQTLRTIGVQITGQAVHDPNVIRSVQGSVRLRNDLVSGTCP